MAPPDASRSAVALRYLTFDVIEGNDGVTTIEALASTATDQHPEVIAEAQSLLDWAWATFPHTQGPADDGADWDHDLQVTLEDGGWCAVTLTLTASPRFVDAFMARFGSALD